ncbi:MAG: CheR family methyltransferase [Leptolyngbyaceae cyanobacterium bins.302]|nr:CheR family methyltransferase [Leptolyngbyaceae cyanobacterium bins.302]
MNLMISDRPPLLSSTPQIGDDINLLRLIDLVANTLGIHIQPQHQPDFKKTLLTRIRTLGLSSLNAYYQHLMTRNQSISGRTEWQKLISLLTVTETYFFRDQGQFWLLKNQILPELIERKRQVLVNSNNGQKPTLRIWSAGCSTGEEAYSLAMLLKDLIPDYREWDILILGTDINQPAIELAQQGIYSDWSFRTTDPEIRSRYFRAHKKDWKIDSSIQSMVTFQAGNLVQDPYPDYISRIHELDLILCRNVFIYFDCNAIAQVLQKFYHSLIPGGFLLTGHAELHGQNTQPFQVKSFPQSVIYQKEISYPDPLLFKEVEGLNSIPRPQALLDARQQSLTQKAGFIQTEQLLNPNSQPFQTYCLNAESYANLGHYTDAAQACQQALQINPLAIEPYHVLAQIAEEQGDIHSAKLFLKRIIYLTPDAISAYLELGAIYQQEGNAKQAQKTWRSLLEVLNSLSQEQVINDHNPQTIAELKVHILKHIV